MIKENKNTAPMIPYVDGSGVEAITLKVPIGTPLPSVGFTSANRMEFLSPNIQLLILKVLPSGPVLSFR